MSKTYIPKDLRLLVAARANYRCEYCMLPDEASSTREHWMEHIIPEVLEGITDETNLAYDCKHCNLNKSTHIVGFDRDGTRADLFNPRTQSWAEHFTLDEHEIIGLTPEGQVTAKLLKFNDKREVAKRKKLIARGQYQVPQPEPEQRFPSEQERKADYDARRRIVKQPRTRSSSIMRQNQASREARENTERSKGRGRE